ALIKRLSTIAIALLLITTAAAKQKGNTTTSADTLWTLTENDYRQVAAELGIEVAAIKALSAIEAGNQPFYAPGKPIINFDLSVFRSALSKAGINVNNARKQAPIAFASVNTKKYGGYGPAQQARLDDACRVNRRVALESTFWGMFQLGGFTYRLCGCANVEEMVSLMSQSADMQLELFARFIKASGLLQHIRNHNWLAFARVYNGKKRASYYSSRLAAAYNKYK
ncbi:MAG: N-acetylmuramidase family protein, partial [Muribaculaceae bacterium]|nr:N-acetylmuramidase family protein [Muribaculaceae bacterium]